jgi:hypothetical protein
MTPAGWMHPGCAGEQAPQKRRSRAPLVVALVLGALTLCGVVGWIAKLATPASTGSGYVQPRK